jgi:hypothetical protein
MVIKNYESCKVLCTGHFTTVGGDAVISQQSSSLEGRELIALTSPNHPALGYIYKLTKPVRTECKVKGKIT